VVSSIASLSGFFRVQVSFLQAYLIIGVITIVHGVHYLVGLIYVETLR
jgi:hypothetical protein